MKTEKWWIAEMFEMLERENGKSPGRIILNDVGRMLNKPILNDELTDIANWLLIRIGRKNKEWFQNNF